MSTMAKQMKVDIGVQHRLRLGARFWVWLVESEPIEHFRIFEDFRIPVKEETR